MVFWRYDLFCFYIVYVCKNNKILHIGLFVRNGLLRNNVESTTGCTYKGELLCSIARIFLLILQTQFYCISTEQFVTKEVIEYQITCWGKSNILKLTYYPWKLNLEYVLMKYNSFLFISKCHTEVIGRLICLLSYIYRIID